MGSLRVTRASSSSQIQRKKPFLSSSKGLRNSKSNPSNERLNKCSKVNSLKSIDLFSLFRIEAAIGDAVSRSNCNNKCCTCHNVTPQGCFQKICKIFTLIQW